MGFNLVYDNDGIYTLNGEPIQEGRYRIKRNGNIETAWISVEQRHRFKTAQRRAFITLTDDSRLDVVKHRIQVDVPDAPHRIPGEGAWHGSGGVTCC